jgi:hypothetical protein
MYLVYMGESGNTGNSVKDPNQQHHVHAGVLVHETQSIAVNGEFNALYRRHFGGPPGEAAGPKGLRPADVYQGRGFFSSWAPAKRAELIQDCLNILIRRETPVIISYVDKKEFIAAKADPANIYATADTATESAINRFFFALNMFMDEMSITDMNPDQMMNSEWPMRDYTLVVANESQSVQSRYMDEFLHSEYELPSSSVMEDICYVGAGDSVCAQLANMCAYFTRRWLQDPTGSHGYFETLRDGRVIQVMYQVQF